MLKKVLSLMLALIMITAMVSGCTIGTNSKEGTGDTAPSTTISKENFNLSGYPIVNTPITVTSMFAPGTDDGKPQDMSYWKKLEEVTNIHIEWKMISSSDPSAIQLYFAAGDLPDFLHAYVGPDYQNKYGVEGGMFYDYSKLLYQYMPNLVSVFKEHPQAEKAIKQLNGAVYTLPRIQIASTSAIGQMFYRTDYLEKLNLKTPTTIDEFYKVLVAIKNSDLTKGFAPLLPYSAAHFIAQTEPFFFAAFGSSTEPDFADNGSGKVVFNRTSDQYKKYLEFMNKLYTEKLLENEMFTLDTATTAARVKAGQAAFMSMAANLLEADFPDGKIHLDCLAPLTSEYTNTKKVRAYPSISTQGAAINKNSKYVKELLRMFDVNYSKTDVVPGSGLNCYSQNLGLQGVDWEFTKPDKSAYAFKLPIGFTESVWTYVTRFASWNQYYSSCVLLATSGSGNSLARETGMMKNNIPYAVAQFPDALMKYSAEESNKIANKLTDINNYVTQARAQFITGVEPLSNWNAYVKKINDMGIADVLQVKQVAYDRWNAK